MAMRFPSPVLSQLRGEHHEKVTESRPPCHYPSAPSPPPLSRIVEYWSMTPTGPTIGPGLGPVSPGPGRILRSTARPLPKATVLEAAMEDVRLRPATIADDAFLYELHRRTLGDVI